MNNKIKTLMILAGLVILIAGATFGYSMLKDKTPAENSVAQGPAVTSSSKDAPERMEAPNFSVTDKDGNIVSLSDKIGTPIVLNFWASWCPPCKGEMPDFDEVFLGAGDDVVFMMVDMTDGVRETKEKGEAYVKKQGFSFPVYYDVDQEAAYNYEVSSIPTTIFIDKDGYIVTGYKGAISKQTLLKGIELAKGK